MPCIPGKIWYDKKAYPGKGIGPRRTRKERRQHDGWTEERFDFGAYFQKVFCGCHGLHGFGTVFFPDHRTDHFSAGSVFPSFLFDAGDRSAGSQIPGNRCGHRCGHCLWVEGRSAGDLFGGFLRRHRLCGRGRQWRTGGRIHRRRGGRRTGTASVQENTGGYHHHPLCHHCHWRPGRRLCGSVCAELYVLAGQSGE